MIKVYNKTPQTVSIHRADKQSVGLEQRYEIHVGGGDIPEYAGPYEVTPTAEAQVLETAQKKMTDDVDIRGIPYYEVSNPSGGTTVYIAGNLDD